MDKKAFIKSRSSPQENEAGLNENHINEEVAADGSDQPDSPKRMRPNPAFLTNFVSGIKRTNQRLAAETTANAACKVGKETQACF